MTTARRWPRRVRGLAVFVQFSLLGASFVAPASAAPVPRARLVDLQGDLMIWAPSLAPNCTAGQRGLFGKPEDPLTRIQCQSTWNSGANLVPQGIRDGWVWSVTVIRYPQTERQVLYDAAKARGYTHFAVQVTPCEVSTTGNPDTAYHGMYPVRQSDCDGNWLGQNVTYIDRLNTVLSELKQNGLTAICAGVSPDVPAAPALNKALCPVAMTDWDNSSDAECRLQAIHDAFPNAWLYYEIPFDVVEPTTGGRCSPMPVSDGDSWIAAMQRKFPKFSGVLYEFSGGGRYLPDLGANGSYLDRLNVFWRSTQQVRFEVDTYQKFWYNSGATPSQSYDVYNSALQARAPWLEGFMSGGSTHAQPTPDVTIDFGALGLWTYFDGGAGGWRQWHARSPSVLEAADLDGNGQTDIVASFPDPGDGETRHLWAFMNNQGWVALHPFSAANVQAGDLNGNGRDELVVDFPGLGIWIRNDDGSWRQLHPFNGRTMVVADIDGADGGRADVVVSFPGHGLWVFRNNQTWEHQHPFSATDLQAGDLDGNGIFDLVVQFAPPVVGQWVLYNAARWVQLHPASAQGVVIADVDGDSQRKDDVIINFPGHGVWAFVNDRWWSLIHPTNATLVTTGDVDRSGHTDLVVSFNVPGDGGASGVWVRRSERSWTKINGSPAEAGASGAIGTAAVAQSTPDGYTFAVVFDTHGVNPSLNPNLGYDARKDLAAVAQIGTSAMVLATHADTAYKSFGDVIVAAKAKKAVSYGSIGSGSLGHLAIALLAKGDGLELNHVPYRGGGPLMNDAIAGHVPLSVGSVFLIKPHIDSKRLRGLAVTTSKRSPQLPDVPTIAESGYAGFEAPAWWAVLAPAKTPPEVVARMNQEINKALQSPEVAAKLAAQGIEVRTGTPAQAQAFIDKQIDIWAKVVKDNGIKPE